MDTKERTEKILLDYLEKATGTDATPVDVANIPAVAKLLIEAI